jgi:3-hydroxyacyl-[acyl-carrier-protein] dehydratase
VRFVLVDRIVELEPGRRIVAQKGVSLAEEYLADHFPKFPVLPGVMMVEAMVQSAAWLVRESLDFAPSVVVLKEARNVTYKSFVAPGRVLTIEALCQELDAQHSVFAARGELDGREIVKGRLTLRHLSLADLDPAQKEIDARLRDRQRALFKLLWNGGPTSGRSGQAGAGQTDARQTGGLSSNAPVAASAGE